MDDEPLPDVEPVRLFRLHKPMGVVSTARDPEGRRVLDQLIPPELPRLMPIGRLDINSEGLILMTNDGGLKRRLELPSTGWLRRYKVRAYGSVMPDALKALEQGITIDGIVYGPILARLDSRKGANAWYSMGLKEGKNREVRRVLDHLGLKVSRLIRTAYGPFQANGELAAFSTSDLVRQKTWALRGRVVWGPQAVGELVLLATDDDQLHAFDEQLERRVHRGAGPRSVGVGAAGPRRRPAAGIHPRRRQPARRGGQRNRTRGDRPAAQRRPVVGGRPPAADRPRRRVALREIALTLDPMAQQVSPAAAARRSPSLLRAGCAVFVFVVLAVAASLPSPAQDADEDKRPLFKQEPYDEIHLREGAVVKVELLPLEGRVVPENPRGTDKLIVKRLGETDPYEVLWRSIEKIRLWEQVLLDEADRLVAAERFNEAYEFFGYLRQPPYRDRLPGLNNSIQGYYFAEARYSHRKGQYDQALALLLYELYTLNAEYAGLEAEMAATANALIAQHLDRQDYAAARQLLAGLQARFPQNQVAARRQTELTAEAAKLLAAAREHFEAGRMHDAREGAYASVRVWPLEEAAQLLSEGPTHRAARRRRRHRAADRLRPGPPRTPRRLGRPAQRTPRASHPARVHRARAAGWRLPLPAGRGGADQPGPLAGAAFEPQCPLVGRVAADRRRSQPPLAGHGRAGALRLPAGLGRPVRRRLRAQRVRGPDSTWPVATSIPTRCCRRRSSPGAASTRSRTRAPPPARTAFRKSRATSFATGRTNTTWGAGSKQPKEIVERFFADGRSAAAALRRGEIALVDRVNPWEVEPLRAEEQIEVRPYAVPTVHCLIPNPDRPWMQVGLLRRAVTYGINRAAILEQLLRGAESTDNRVISGPFPAGGKSSDPRGYAYNTEVAPRRYDPRLALTLGSLALREQAAAAKQRKEEPPEQLPPLVLVHPPDDLARVACRAIKRQLALVSVPIVLREFSAEPFTEPPEYDLRYAELAVWEPIVDARRLFGPEGITGNRNDYLRLALRQLERANDWRSARLKLLEIHRIAYDDVSLLPLWQLTDHYAYHRSLQGVGDNLVTLYQNVEQWQSPPAVVPELARRPAAGEGTP